MKKRKAVGIVALAISTIVLGYSIKELVIGIKEDK